MKCKTLGSILETPPLNGGQVHYSDDSRIVAQTVLWVRMPASNRKVEGRFCVAIPGVRIGIQLH
eukprot:3876248-Amphidinium_carterae.1